VRFEKGNTLGGRPRGSKNKLAKSVLEDLLAIWNEPLRPDSDLRRGPAALRVMSKERPADFCKLYASVLPKELWLESTAQELSDDELDRVIENIRQRLPEQREEKALDAAVDIKMVPHVNG
jgi:hypothetical protein